MAKIPNPTTELDQPMVYRIRIEGHLGPRWEDWLGGPTITLDDNGDTILMATVADQAALHGLLKRVRDLAMPLLSVERTTPDQTAEADAT